LVSPATSRSRHAACDPNDYRLVALEDGIEAVGFQEFGASESLLQAWTAYN
jgi:hypothetical protein